MVEVRCSPDREGATRAEVTYALTAPEPAARPALEKFAAGYEAETDGWERDIAAALAAGRVH